MKRLFVFLLFVVIVVGGISLWWINGVKAVGSGITPEPSLEQMFIIQKGKGIREVSSDLKRQGLIRDPIVFFLYLKLTGNDKKIQAGLYQLSPVMNVSQIVETLLHGTNDIWVTIPEGLRGEEIGEILKKHFETYRDDEVKELISENGYLFPDTYLMPKKATIQQIISVMKENFVKKINSVGLRQDSPNLGSIVILASLIEREAKTDNEKPVIAGILTNRLKDGMPLQVDATIQYVKGWDEKKESWWGDVSPFDYKNVQSPFNTYLHVGLPPSPIANPGLEALRAAANPASTPYYYYLHDKNGEIHYAETILEHNNNVKNYLPP